MPKNLLQDMVKVKRAKKVHIPEPEPEAIQPQEKKSEIKKVEHRGHKKNRTRYGLWGVAVFSILFLIFALSYLFLSAKVIVIPKIQDVALNENISAIKDSNADTLSFDVVVISGEENKSVSSTEQKELTQPATGVVIIYNTFSSAPQILNIDTRLEGSNGKIYKTDKQVVVPGMQGSTPGSLEVGVYAAEAGEEYNSGPLDFTIFGFKGTPKYSKFYGRSKGDLDGGFEGNSFVLSDAQKASLKIELGEALKTKLFQKATSQIPDGFILFKDAVFITTDESNISTISSRENTLALKVKGTLYGILFNEEKLTKKIAQLKIAKYDGSPVYIPHIRDLTFSLRNESEEYTSFASRFENIKNINFNLKGDAKIIWQVDTEKLKESLVGKSKKEFNQILLQYASIDSADLTVSPVWRGSIPDKLEDIEVTVSSPE